MIMIFILILIICLLSYLIITKFNTKTNQNSNSNSNSNSFNNLRLARLGRNLIDRTNIPGWTLQTTPLNINTNPDVLAAYNTLYTKDFNSFITKIYNTNFTTTEDYSLIKVFSDKQKDIKNKFNTTSTPTILPRQRTIEQIYNLKIKEIRTRNSSQTIGGLKIFEQILMKE